MTEHGELLARLVSLNQPALRWWRLPLCALTRHRTPASGYCPCRWAWSIAYVSTDRDTP